MHATSNNVSVVVWLNPIYIEDRTLSRLVIQKKTNPTLSVVMAFNLL